MDLKHVVNFLTFGRREPDSLPPNDPEADLQRRLEKAFDRMPALQRDIFLAHRQEGLSYAEIAARTGLSIATVERNMARAIARLDRQLNGERLTFWDR